MHWYWRMSADADGWMRSMECGYPWDKALLNFGGMNQVTASHF